jgi:hypothetical protein
MKANGILVMDETNWKQTCVRIINSDSNLAKIKQIMEASDILLMDEINWKQACIR